jgi:hypothetical protein
MDHSDIARVAKDIVMSPLSQMDRVRRYGALYPALPETYPRLFTMCCNTPAGSAAAAHLLELLPYMLSRLSDLDAARAGRAVGGGGASDGSSSEAELQASKDAMDAASAEVVGRLNAIYVDPVVGPEAHRNDGAHPAAAVSAAASTGQKDTGGRTPASSDTSHLKRRKH